jgi:hypothetical protein
VPAHEDHATPEEADADGHRLDRSDGIRLKPRFARGDVRDRQLGDRGIQGGGDADQLAALGCAGRRLG